MTIETEEDLRKLRVVGKVVAGCLRRMAEAMEPGMTTAELDEVGREFLERHGARSAPKLTYDFPGWTCISVDEEVAHGVPGSRRLREGDLVNIDVSAEIDGYFADTGGSFPLGTATPKQAAVCRATKTALAEAMKKAKAGAPLNHIGKAVETVAKKSGLRVIRDLCSHGVGRALHEEPGQIPSFFDPRDRRALHKGLVITIEPFLTNGPSWVAEADDGWTLCTAPGSITAQYEHTMVITDGKPIVLTLPG